MSKLLFCAGLFSGENAGAAASPTIEFPKTAIDRSELAVIVNESDPLSIRIGAYYQEQRKIPDANIIRVRFPPQAANLPSAVFAGIRQEVERRVPASVQAYALAWTAPYRVDCMAITSAFALGFDRAYCSARRCGMTKPSGYFNAQGSAPYTARKLRPAMMLAGRSFADVKALIDRGVASDHSYPRGTGYLLNTSDRARSVRAAGFRETRQRLGEAFRLEVADADFIKDRNDVLFYFTGLEWVDQLPTLRFLPGAVADHLTSSGGQLLADSGQMSSLRWLEAGATASYGTVVEPCNLLAKFPYPAILMWHYATGNTVLEAYWKSVASPGEGVFIGEPLARPFAPEVQELDGRRFRLKLFSPARGSVRLEAAVSPVGPYRPSPLVYPLHPGLNELTMKLPAPWQHYRLAYVYR